MLEAYRHALKKNLTVGTKTYKENYQSQSELKTFKGTHLLLFRVVDAKRLPEGYVALHWHHKHLTPFTLPLRNCLRACSSVQGCMPGISQKHLDTTISSDKLRSVVASGRRGTSTGA
eukprot:467108-Pelagomonas_calceolata.AAC.6